MYHHNDPAVVANLKQLHSSLVPKVDAEKHNYTKLIKLVESLNNKCDEYLNGFRQFEERTVAYHRENDKHISELSVSISGNTSKLSEHAGIITFLTSNLQKISVMESEISRNTSEFDSILMQQAQDLKIIQDIQTRLKQSEFSSAEFRKSYEKTELEVESHKNKFQELSILTDKITHFEERENESVIKLKGQMELFNEMKAKENDVLAALKAQFELVQEKMKLLEEHFNGTKLNLEQQYSTTLREAVTEKKESHVIPIFSEEPHSEIEAVDQHLLTEAERAQGLKILEANKLLSQIDSNNFALGQEKEQLETERAALVKNAEEIANTKNQETKIQAALEINKHSLKSSLKSAQSHPDNANTTATLNILVETEKGLTEELHSTQSEEATLKQKYAARLQAFTDDGKTFSHNINEQEKLKRDLQTVNFEIESAKAVIEKAHQSNLFRQPLNIPQQQELHEEAHNNLINVKTILMQLNVSENTSDYRFITEYVHNHPALNYDKGLITALLTVNRSKGDSVLQ